MNFRLLPSLLFLLVAGMVSCVHKPQPANSSLENLIPMPVSVKATGGTFELTTGTSIFVEGQSQDALRIGQYLADKLKPATGFALNVSVASGAPKPGNILLVIAADTALGEEGYELAVTKDLVKLTANKPAGLFRGIQTIRQLLPASIELTGVQQVPWKMATATIRDYPLYAIRGSMLDVARHFFGVEDVKRYIDLLAFYKMNLLHLHLSDDQGWRIEIKSWPNLTTHGGSSEVGGGKGGFYTQEQYKEIVQYAADRFITIIPEIDMPGHTNAALASYAELNCNDTATKLYTGMNVGFSTLCTKKELTYKFIDDVIGELAALTPGPYLHIGGDESHATKKEDYIPFVTRVQEIVKKHGKLAIGWDEIALTKLQPNTVAQYWADSANSKAAVNQGAKIMMSPAIKAYLDMKYDSTTKLGQHWAAYIEVDSAYSWNPATLVQGIGYENILGIEAALWTETIATMDDIEYMVFPRLPGYAEIGWSPVAGRSWDEYKIRLGNHGSRMKAMNVDFYKSKRVPWAE
ncbi:MAG: Beta-N-acetylhexosaminidase [Chitinophagaceae bacterium]|nr:Beta-N-acetylhexosaminidase [Chitinophagaceae bacterium]